MASLQGFSSQILQKPTLSPGSQVTFSQFNRAFKILFCKNWPFCLKKTHLYSESSFFLSFPFFFYLIFFFPFLSLFSSALFIEKLEKFFFLIPTIVFNLSNA